MTHPAARLGGVGILTPDDLADLNAGVVRVYDLMKDGAWHSALDICLAAGEDGIPASEGLRRMRELRDHYDIEKRRVKKGSRLYEYRLQKKPVPDMDLDFSNVPPPPPPSMFTQDTVRSLIGDEGWARLLFQEFIHEDRYMDDLVRALKSERKTHTIYPAPDDVFRAFRETPLSEVKVVIIGQDPYHTPGKAHGLAFSVPEGEGRPPSLRNIMKEVESDVGFSEPSPSPDLTRWAQQGVLLLNTSLTVRKGDAGSHADLAGGAWPRFTRAAIRHLTTHYAGQADLFDPDSGPKRRLAYLLWGSHARGLKDVCDPKTHEVFESAHPSPYSAHKGFFGTKPFSKANAVLEAQGLAPIRW